MHAAFLFINFLFLTIALLVIPKCCNLADFFTQTAGFVGGFFILLLTFLKRSNVKTVFDALNCSFFYMFKNFLKHSVL